MTEFWVSQKKHFCEYCKVWTGGHLWQIRKHEEGRMHQEKKELYLKNCRIREKDRQREKQDIKKQLAEIEKAAQAAVQRDEMREMEGLVPEEPSDAPPPSSSRPPRVVGGGGGGFAFGPGPMYPEDPVLSMDQQKAAIHMAVAAAQKRRADEEKAKIQAKAGPELPQAQPKAPVPVAEGSPWLLCTDPNSGKTYFYNKVSKKSSWQRPAELGPDPSAPAPPGPPGPPGAPGGPPGPPPRKPPPPPAKPQSVGVWQVVLPEESMWANHAEIAAAREMERAQAAFEEGDEAPSSNPIAELKTEISGRKGTIADEDVEKHEKVMEQKRSLTSGSASFPVKRTKATGIRKKRADDDE